MIIERQITLEHNHNHNHEPPTSLKNLIFAMVINGGIVVFEMIFGLLLQSMALISDAVHNVAASERRCWEALRKRSPSTMSGRFWSFPVIRRCQYCLTVMNHHYISPQRNIKGCIHERLH